MFFFKKSELDQLRLDIVNLSSQLTGLRARLYYLESHIGNNREKDDNLAITNGRPSYKDLNPYETVLDYGDIKLFQCIYASNPQDACNKALDLIRHPNMWSDYVRPEGFDLIVATLNKKFVYKRVKVLGNTFTWAGFTFALDFRKE